MKKIPTLFQREYVDHKIATLLDEVTPGCEEILQGNTIATVKYDGSCCAIINGELYKRYDAKNGKKPPEGAIPCQPDPDPVTGHWPHWVKCDRNKPEDKYFWEGYDEGKNHTIPAEYMDATYELIGPALQANPYNSTYHCLIMHGMHKIEELSLRPLTKDMIRDWLDSHIVEGIVFWKRDHSEPVCKIKRSDFGFKWPYKEMWK